MMRVSSIRRSRNTVFRPSGRFVKTKKFTINNPYGSHLETTWIVLPIGCPLFRFSSPLLKILDAHRKYFNMCPLPWRELLQSRYTLVLPRRILCTPLLWCVVVSLLHVWHSFIKKYIYILYMYPYVCLFMVYVPVCYLYFFQIGERTRTWWGQISTVSIFHLYIVLFLCQQSKYTVIVGHLLLKAENLYDYTIIYTVRGFFIL